jgi:uncharacterized membrane protein
MSKKMKLMFVSSLLLNVLLVGFVLGDLSHRFRQEPFLGKHGRELALRLPQDKAKLVLETLRRVHEVNRGAHEKVREARKKAMKILADPEFNEAAYRAEVETIHELRGLMKRRLADATVQLAKHFSQEDRRALARHLRRALRPPGRPKPPRHGKKPYPEVF